MRLILAVLLVWFGWNHAAQSADHAESSAQENSVIVYGLLMDDVRQLFVAQGFDIIEQTANETVQSYFVAQRAPTQQITVHLTDCELEFNPIHCSGIVFRVEQMLHGQDKQFILEQFWFLHDVGFASDSARWMLESHIDTAGRSMQSILLFFQRFFDALTILDDPSQ